MYTVTAPIKAADTIRKLFFEEEGAATNQERLLIKKYFLKLTLYDFKYVMRDEREPRCLYQFCDISLPWD